MLFLRFGPWRAVGLWFHYFSNVSVGKKKSEIATMKYIHVSKVSMKSNGDLLLLAVKLKIY